jgi:hypothetical protein
MKHPTASLASLWLAILSPSVQADMIDSPAYLQVSQVANSKDLTPSKKVTRLRQLFDKGNYSGG